MKLRDREMFKIGPIGSDFYPHKSWDEKGLNSDEYVTGLSVIDCLGITGLNIHTNQRKHGPFCDRYSSSIHMEKHKREIDVKIRDRREFGGFFGSFHEFQSLKSIGIYVNPMYDNKLTFNQAWDPQYTSALHYQIPTIVDGIPVKHIRYKTKLKDRILSKLRSISKELFCAS
ncbi:PREDICTED: jacalin-related lectin 24-like [Camelina sativa]|uniref:Jacalin-related lectin 24-like n=1 Tax=Camelina sativa TaxID=90675 RepID=A0ABM1Q6I4_CAMSA|nr:PREDICTED: jacalin-related lectin 24-like [Camelina sativa]